MEKYIHKKSGKPYELVTTNFMFKQDGVWIEGLCLYKALYENPVGEFFARTREDFFKNFEKKDSVE